MRPSNQDATPRHDAIGALLALALIALLGAYQLWDARGAFTEFDGWWAYAPPAYSGDDYALATTYAEKQEDWHDRYRAISLGMAVKRARPGASLLVTPPELWSLWGTSADAPRSWEAPGIKEDYFGWVTMHLGTEPNRYDPALPDEYVRDWRESGYVTDMPWNVAYVDDGQDDDVLILHTDADRSVVYVVPLHLSPEGTP